MKKKSILSFSGESKNFLTGNREFHNFLNKHFKDFEHHYFFDNNEHALANTYFYHRGLNYKTKGIDDSVEYIKKIIKPYDETIFIGSSVGGYAAILFGCLSGATKILAFKPQTDIIDVRPMNNHILDKRYVDLTKIKLDGPIIQIHGDLRFDSKTHDHWRGHVERMNIRDNIEIVLHDSLDLKQLRNSGKLLEIFNNFILGNNVNI